MPVHTLDPPSATMLSADGNESLDDVPLALLEAEITTLAGHLAAATCRFLLLLASFDTREGWSGAGMRSCAQWLSWRCGMGLSTAREHLRVAHALTALPATTTAFTAGRLSYAKARAITRVATAATESGLVDIALNAPAAHVDRLVAGLRRAQTLDQDNQVTASAEHRHRWDDDGALVLTVRLAPEDGAAYLAALYATRDALDDRQVTGSDVPASSASGDDPPVGDSPAGEFSGVEPTTLVQAFVVMAESAHEHLPALGPSGHRPEVVVHVDIDVLTAAEADAEPGEAAEAGGAAEGVRPDHQSTCRIQDGPGLLPQVARQLACDAGIVVAVRQGQGLARQVLDIGRRQRRPDSAILRSLWIRDQGCVHPACRRRRNLHAHHVVHWAHGGATALHNLVLLCRYHHRALHRGQIDIQLIPGQPPTVSSAGRVLLPAPATTGEHTAIPTTHAADITAHTTTPTDWLGDPLHLGYAVTSVLDAWGQRSDGPHQSP